MGDFPVIIAGGRTPRLDRYDTLQNLIEGESIRDDVTEFGAERRISGDDSRHTIKITLSDPVLVFPGTLNIPRVLGDDAPALRPARNEPHMRYAHRRA